MLIQSWDTWSYTLGQLKAHCDLAEIKEVSFDDQIDGNAATSTAIIRSLIKQLEHQLKLVEYSNYPAGQNNENGPLTGKPSSAASK